MADVNPTETGLTVKITDGTASEMVAVLTTTPGASEAALVVREVARGQGTAATSIPVVLASDQGALTVTSTFAYAEDSIHTSGDVGSFVLGVRNDTFSTTFTNSNGDYSPIAVDSLGRIFTANAKLEDSAHVSGDAGSFVLAVRNDTFATSFTSANADYSPIAVDVNGKVFTGDNRAEDAAHASGHIGSFVLGVRNDASAVRTSADSDYSPISVDSAGRVLVADGGGSISIDDNGGSLTVDGTVTTNSEKSEDSVHTSGDTGSFILAVRNDSQTALAANGDYIPLTVDSTGALWVTGSLQLQSGYLEDSVHTSGDRGLFVLSVRNDSSSTLTSTNGDYSPISVDSAGRVLVADGGGSISIDDNAGSITVDGTVAVSSVAGSVAVIDGGGSISIDDNGGSITVDGTVTSDTNFDYSEDSIHTSGDIGAFVLAVRNDSAATLTSTNGDYSPIAVDSAGRPLVAQPTASVLNAQVVGEVAHDGVDSGNPVKIGGVARQSNPTAVANADRAQLMTDDVGRLVTVTSHVRDLVVKQTTDISSASETTILTAGGAGVFRDITHISFSSTQNNVVIQIRDATAGSTIWQGRVDQDNVTVLNFNPPMPQTTANNNWTIQRDTGTGNLYVNVVAVSNV